MHALWNTLAIFFAFSTIADYFELEHPLRDMTLPINIAMAVFAVILCGILIGVNRMMKAGLPQPAVPESPVPALQSAEPGSQ
jgi:hypothetical protein